ncbi:MAG TPA: polysaccharide biosynthesis/export family protein [Planctomycetota bacterium]|nr:polysaccharide biosynthesis/export family protein [Planctomycetota bacterium]
MNMWFRRLFFLLCFIVLALLMGCGRTVSTFAVPQEDNGRSLALIQQISESLPCEDYRLGTGDVIDVKVHGVKDLDTTLQIPASGTFEFPLVGTVKAAGCSAPEVEQTIAKALTERYMNEAYVSVFVKEYNSYRVSVVGAVTKPGTVILKKANCTLVDALAEAGGLTEKAGNEVHVGKSDGAGGNSVRTVDLKALLEKGDLGQNVPLKAGDSVYVPEGGYVFVTGYVKTPGAYPLRKDMTALQAIGAAGDFTTTSSRRVRLVRRTSPDHVEVQTIDLAAACEGKASDVTLEKSDVIEAQPSLWKVPVYGTFDFIKSVLGISTQLQ